MTYGLMLVMHLGSSGREKENLICPGIPVNGLKETWRPNRSPVREESQKLPLVPLANQQS